MNEEPEPKAKKMQSHAGTPGDHVQFNGLGGRITRVEGDPPTAYGVSFSDGTVCNVKPEEVTISPREGQLPNTEPS